MGKPALFGIAGWKGSGKTTLIARLLPLLAAAGLKVATVKHSHHALRPPDGATDGERHARAGAIATLVIGTDGWELNGERRADAPPAIGDLAALLPDADLVIVEGLKRAAIPKLEVRRRATATQEPLAASDARVVAIASDTPQPAELLPVFDLDDVAAIAGFIAARAR